MKHEPLDFFEEDIEYSIDPFKNAFEQKFLLFVAYNCFLIFVPVIIALFGDSSTASALATVGLIYMFLAGGIFLMCSFFKSIFLIRLYRKASYFVTVSILIFFLFEIL